jgi:hypothetical protein
MANGDHDWVAGEQVTAANMDDYLMLQAVQKFATSAARDAALATRKREGMVTYQDDANSLTNYSGAAWSTIGPVNGALTTWTPTITQLATPTFTNNNSWYSRVGRLILGGFFVTLTGSGTAANVITLALPVAANASSGAIGSGHLFDSSSGENHTFIIYFQTSTTVKLLGTSYNATSLANLTLGTGVAPTFSQAVATGDTISGVVQYHASTDA